MMPFSSVSSNGPLKEELPSSLKQRRHGTGPKLARKREIRRVWPSGGKDNFADLQVSGSKMSLKASARFHHGFWTTWDAENGGNDDNSRNFCESFQQFDIQSEVSPCIQLMETNQIDAILPRAAAVTFVVWIVITVVVYASAPSENRVHLQGAERTVAFLAFVIFVIMILTSVLPYLVGFQGRRQVSGVMIAGLVIQLVNRSDRTCRWHESIGYALDLDPRIV